MRFVHVAKGEMRCPECAYRMASGEGNLTDLQSFLGKARAVSDTCTKVRTTCPYANERTEGPPASLIGKAMKFLKGGHDAKADEGPEL